MNRNKWWDEQQSSSSLPKLEIPYSRAKEEVWQQMETMINKQPASPRINKAPKRFLSFYMAVAAAFMVLLGTSAFFRYYTKTVEAVPGQHLITLLPDGSSISLNAGSSIQYNPLWWPFRRQVQLRGEAFFSVAKSKTFEVVSDLGRTRVLGTRFNIYTRYNQYKVSCYSGKVRVESVLSGETADITANMQACIQPDGKVLSETHKDVNEAKSWRDGMFTFTACPLYQVFEEVERQYGIHIQTPQKLEGLYSGNFTRSHTADEVMHLICRSMGLQFEKTADGYRVY
ncbi:MULTISPECIES: FecR family protein [unclassified Carboxylicivirga]|uniref:FecR family protein n=1 Tax=Carboxylicivirga TaxID=1628153 RepID=UPI003D32E1EC